MTSVTVQHDPRPGATGLIEAVAAAVLAADAAARAAGVVIREITDRDGFEAVCRLYHEIWQPDPHNPPVTPELLRALTKAGNYVVGAFDGVGLRGACVGFFGPPADTALHSHITGVAASAPGRHIGFAIKAHQRAWAMQRGIATIGWTFDPLVSRNAYFNVVKLAAAPAEYLTNFYGDMHDGINGSDDTDRLLIQWDLHAPRVGRACAGAVQPGDAEAELRRGAVIGLGRSAEGFPVAGPLDGGTVLVAVPADIAALRASDPDLARQWRVALRGALTTLMGGGARVVGFDRAGWYIVTAPGEDRP